MERVGVEEVPAVRGRRSGDDVVQRALDEIREARLPGGQQQPPGQHHRADPGARLRVGPVRRKHEVVAERLARVRRAHSAGEVRPSGQRHLPLGDERVEEFVVAGLHGNVDGSGGEVHRPHRMASEHRRITDRDIVLEVRLAERDLAERPRAPSSHERRRLIEVALFAGVAGQFGESELDLRMPANPLDPAIGERVAHMVGDPRGDGDKLVAPRRAPSRHRRLEEVAVVVQLVAPLQVAVARPLAGTAEHRVEIAVRLLSRCDDLGQRPKPLVGIGRPTPTDLPGHRLHQLVEVRVGEHHPLVLAGGHPSLPV